VIDNDNYPEGVTIKTRGFDMFVYNK
jgi:hypothetical protein